MAWINGEWVMTSRDYRILERGKEISRKRGVSIVKGFALAEMEIEQEDARCLRNQEKGTAS